MAERSENGFPKARAADLVTERIGDELVVYDGLTSEAHCLKPLATAVFVAADGDRSPADLAAVVSAELGEEFDVAHVEMALAELEDRGLIEQTVRDGFSRRGFMQRSAAVGGAVLAGTLVTSVVAPAYGQAASLPLGPPPSGYSSLAIEFYDGSQYYGAHWNQSSPVGAPASWGATGANANCSLPNAAADHSDGTPANASIVTAQLVSGGIYITVPDNLIVDAGVAFFGKGGNPPCNTCVALTISKSGTGYLASFPAACY